MRVKSSRVNSVLVFVLLFLVICGCGNNNRYYQGVAIVKEIKVSRRANPSASANQNANNNQNSNANVSSKKKASSNTNTAASIETDSPEDLMDVVIEFLPDDKEAKIDTHFSHQPITATRGELKEKGIVAGGRYRITATYYPGGKRAPFLYMPPIKDFQPEK